MHITTNRFKRHRLIATTNLIKIENRWRGISLDAVVEVHSDSNYEETRFFITDFNLRHLKVWKKELRACSSSDIAFPSGQLYKRINDRHDLQLFANVEGKSVFSRVVEKTPAF